VLVDKKDPTLKGALLIGGDGEGGANKSSFAHKIAWHLSKAVNDNYYDGNLERSFFCIEGLDSFAFGGMKTPSVKRFFMFRMNESNDEYDKTSHYDFDLVDLSFDEIDFQLDIIDFSLGDINL